MAIEMGDNDSNRSEDVRSDDSINHKRDAPRFEILQTFRGGHSHFQKEQAEDALKQCQKQGIVDRGHFFTLQAADESNYDATEQQKQTGVQENLVQQFRT